MATGAINIKKNNYNKNPKDFCIYTPQEITAWLRDIVLSETPYANILDMCCGSGNLSNSYSFMSHRPFNITGVDVIERHEYLIDTTDYVKADFVFDREQDDYLKQKEIEIILCNPPWNGCPGKKMYPYEFLKRFIEVFGINIPIILFTPMGLLLNWRYGAKRERGLQEYFDQGLELSSIASMPIDAFYPGSKSKGQQWQILFFNMPFLKPHYLFSSKIKEKYGYKHD